jgi:hypothetical protein
LVFLADQFGHKPSAIYRRSGKMMGNKARLNGEEWEAFHPRSRRLVLLWRRGELRRIKSKFARKARKLAKLAARDEARA